VKKLKKGDRASIEVAYLLTQESNMINISPTSEQIEQLRELRYRHPVVAVQRRAEIVLLADWQPFKRSAVAEFAGVHVNTVTNVLRRFNESGVEGLLQADPNMPDPELDAYNHLIKQVWCQDPPATLKQAAWQLEKATGLRRSLTDVRRLLLKLGFSRRKAGSVPAKADPEAQKEFLHYHMQRHLNAAKCGKMAVFSWMPVISCMERSLEQSGALRGLLSAHRLDECAIMCWARLTYSTKNC
jgi:transposase